MKGILCLVQFLVTFFITFCNGQDDNCTTGDLRLYNVSSPGQGMLQLCNSSNLWTAFCSDSFLCEDSMVACRQLGFNDSRPIKFPEGYFGKWDNITNTYYSCSGTEPSLEDCKTDTPLGPECDITTFPTKTLALACYPPLGNCTHGDLRLVGGESESEGRVEVCYKGGWYSVCETEDEEASVMCKQLGHTVYPWAAVFDDGRFGKTPLSHGYIQFECNDQFSEDQWTDCTISAPSCTNCNGDAIKCFTPPDCEEGSLRLVDGVIENEGRVEVCLEGVWGSVCNESSAWTAIDSYVACKQLNLGASGKAPTAYTSSSVFGDGNQPIVMSLSGCNGWENVLTDCSHTTYRDISCSRDDTVGLLCFDDCEDGEVRLVGGSSDSEGTLEVCLDNLWGLVAESGWSLIDAQVACNQLGLPSSGVQAVNKSRYGKPKKPVHLSNVHCIGGEQNLLACEHYLFQTLDQKKNIFNHVDVAGALCQVQDQNPTNGYNSTDESGSSDLSLSVSLLVPAYLTLFFVMAGFALGIVVLVVCWKKNLTQSNDNANVEKKIPLKSEQRRTMTPHYEMSINKQPHRPVPRPPKAVVHTLPKENETEDFGPLYESTTPLDYSEMS